MAEWLPFLFIYLNLFTYNAQTDYGKINNTSITRSARGEIQWNFHLSWNGTCITGLALVRRYLSFLIRSE